MHAIQALILGLVEGLTEYLPISSTAHMMIAGLLLKVTQSDLTKSFEIVVQAGAILAVGFIYFKKIILDFKLWLIILAGFIPTGILGFLAYPLVKKYFLGNYEITIAALFIGGLVLIWFDRWLTEQKNNQNSSKTKITDIHQISYSTAAWIGLAQCLAFFPGVSRSAATIITGCLLGLSLPVSLEMSFLLAMPTLLAATGYDAIKNIHLLTTPGYAGILLVGFLAAFISALLTVRWFLKAAPNALGKFGWYRIALAAILALLWWRG